MARQDEEVVRDMLDAFNSGDLERWATLVDPEIEWHDLRELPGATVHRGREAVAKHLRSTLDDLPGYLVEAEELIATDGRVVVCGRASAHGRASQAPVERPFFASVEVNDGLVAKVEILSSRSAALGAN